MKYKNKKTGAVVEVKSKITGGGWEPVKKHTKKKTENTESGKENK